MKTNIYIDGLNLYYRAVQGTPHKWLNIVKLFQAMVRTKLSGDIAIID